MGVIDLGFVLAVVAFGWGLSLASYRWFAGHYGWPMGDWQAESPRLTILLGASAVVLAILYALARGYGGYVLSAALIPVFGRGLGRLLDRLPARRRAERPAAGTGSSTLVNRTLAGMNSSGATLPPSPALWIAF